LEARVVTDEPRSTPPGDPPANETGRSDPSGSGPGGFRTLLVHWGIFLGILGATVAINEWQTSWVNIHLAKVTAEVMGWFTRLLGEGGSVTGIHISTNICKFKIIGECTAYYPISIYIAAVLAFPSPWLRRIVGVLVGVPILLVINQGRLVSLCYLQRVYPEHFDMIHLVIWQSLIIFFTVLTWILWVTLYARRS
jgi:archaeosortase B (VPXXXP-CTERM-specific)